MESAESMRCPKCHKIAVQLSTVSSYGTGIKICRRCKRKCREE